MTITPGTTDTELQWLLANPADASAAEPMVREALVTEIRRLRAVIDGTLESSWVYGEDVIANLAHLYTGDKDWRPKS